MFLEAARIPNTLVPIVIYNPTRGVIKKYGECLDKKKYYRKRHFAINPLKTLPLASNTLIPPFLLLSKAVLEVLFRECL